MGLRDEVAKQVGNRNTGKGVFLEDLGLYEIEIIFAGDFESVLGDARYWKVEGVIRNAEEGPLAVGQEVITIHNHSKDKWGYCRDERAGLKNALGVESWEDAAGCLVIVDVWERVTKAGRSINIRSWLASPRNRNLRNRNRNAVAEGSHEADAKAEVDTIDMPF